MESLIPREAAKCQGLKSQEGLENQGKWIMLKAGNIAKIWLNNDWDCTEAISHCI